MALFTRGFRGRGAAELDPRLPPGQYDTGSSWPVLTAEARPRLSSSDWTFTVDGLVEQPMTWTWEQLHTLPPWQRAVVAITPETARAKSYRLHLDRPTTHLPGRQVAK